MKKIITILSFAALLFSCAKPIEQPEVKLNTYTIEADLSSDDTKINYKDGSGYEWAGGEKIAVIKVDSGLGTKTESDGVGSDTQDAHFSVTVADGSYIAVHPETVGIQDGKLQFEFLANQRQTFGGETYSTIYDGSKRIPLVSQTKFELNGENKKVSQKFNPVGALIRFSIYGGDEGEQIRSVSVVAPAGTAIAGTVLYSCSFDGDALTVNPVSHSNTTNKVRVLVHEDAHKAGAADAPSIFATIIPANFQPTYVVETLDKVYTFPSSKEKDFVAGGRYDVKLNLKSTNASIIRTGSKVPQQLFIVGEGTSVGWNPENGIEMTRTENADGSIIFTKDLKMIKDGAYRFLCTNLAQNAYGDGYFNSGDNSSLILAGEGSGYSDFTVTGETGCHTLIVKFDSKTATNATLTAIDSAPYLIVGDNKVQMSNKISDGVYSQEYIFNTSGGDFSNAFSFSADVNKQYKYQPTDGGDYYEFHKTHVKCPNILLGNANPQKQWNVHGYNESNNTKCATLIVLDKYTHTVYCLPQLYVIGGQSGSDVAWSNASWDLGETNYQNNKFTLDYSNKCLSVKKTAVWNNLDFKICSRYTTGWNQDNGIWLTWKNGTNGNFWFTQENRKAGLRVLGYGDPSDAKFLINAKEHDPNKGYFYNKSVTLQINIDKWAWNDGWTLDLVEN